MRKETKAIDCQQCSPVERETRIKIAMDHRTKVFEFYQKKDFSSCLGLIDKAPMGIRESTHYKVLKASCLVNLGKKINEAHQLLDGVIAKETENAFAYYGKGLAFMFQKNFEEAIDFLDKAIEHDKTGSMQKAREMKDEAIKMMTTSDGVVANKENIVTDGEKEERQTKSARTKLSTTMTTATTAIKVNQVIEVQEKEKTKKPNDKSKICSICSKSFTKTFSLNRHMALHTGNRPFKCTQCELSFVQKSDLQRHEATHKDEYNHECKTCLKTFKTKKNLQGHQLVHSTVHSFQCKLCPKTFKLESLLNFHQNLHKSPKDEPFACDICGKTFAEKLYINAHIRTHFNSKLFTCNLCKFTYSTVSRFGHHFREFHVIGKGNV